MAYSKQNFVDQQVLTAEHLNHMEEGISQLSEEKVDESYVDNAVSNEKTERKAEIAVERARINNLVEEKVVKYSAQGLTEAEKAQARNNIGVDGALLLDRSESYKIVLSNNLYNPEDVELGGYYFWHDAKWMPREDLASTGFIACKSGDVFYSSRAGTAYGGNVTFYDENREFVSGLNANPTPFTVPNNDAIKYFRISFYSSIAYGLQYQINKDEIKPYDEYAEGSVETASYVTSYPISAPNIETLEKANRLIFSQSYNNDVSIEHKRSVRFGTSYWLFIINKTKFDGSKTVPIVAGTDDTNPLGGASATNVTGFAAKHDYLHVINGGIFLTATNEADGITIINGEIQKSTGVEQFNVEQYVLGIDASGNFKTYRNETAENILADGSIYAITGFVPLIENGERVSDSVLAICPHYSYPHPRQIVGKLASGDYFTFACDGRTDGENGMTLGECISTLLEDLDVEFAFNLDGGGSTQSVVGKKLVNRMLDNRVVPNVMVFG